VAVLVPTTAWFVSGSRDAARRAHAEVEEALVAVQQRVESDTDRLEHRLATLLASESERPFYHYQSLFHDPRGAAQGLAVMRSPLAAGVTDPLVWAHFQIDESGNVSLPTVNERFPELSTDAGFADFCEVLEELQNGLVVAELADSSTTADGEQVMVLERGAWEQIHLAEAVYASLTGRTIQQPPETVPGDTSLDSVVIRVGSLRWRTIVLGVGPTLAALREVTTPNGLLVQGFAVATAAVSEWLGSDLEFTPVAAVEPPLVSASVGDTDWRLIANAESAFRDAEVRADQVRYQFRRTFGLSSAAALSAALAVVLIVAQTDRLARQRARFAAAAAHELKTPLATLRLHSEMLSDGLGDPDHARSYAERIAPEVRRLGRVVANMLDLSRLERGVALAQPAVGNPGTAVAECVERLRSTLRQSGLEVEMEIDSELPAAVFDRDALCQILDNLLDNADKHTNGVKDRRASVRATADGPDIRITVADNGPGIPHRFRRRMFRPFSRRTDVAAGLGLGLALARSLARAQGGELRLVDSAEGAVFELTLPVAQ
jgi:signal transduction histidine kinase